MINNQNIKDFVKKYVRNRSKLPPELQTIHIRDWDVSAVTDMSNLFRGFRTFNEPLNWNTSNVTNMEGMFENCDAFNQRLPESFNTSNVTNMRNIFKDCYAFNQPLPESFNTSNVTNMDNMFEYCVAFNQRLSESFNTSNVTNMSDMFSHCHRFNQPLPESFNTSNVTNMSDMFLECNLFNQPLPESFNTSNVTNMKGMFAGCASFNQPLPESFNTSNVTNMEYMFKHCIRFNQDISNWNVQNVINFIGMFDNTPLASHLPAWYTQLQQPVQQQPAMQQTPQLVTYDNVTPNPITVSTTSIPDDAVGMDIIEGADINIKQYLRENENGFVFLSYTQYYPIEKEQILHVINTNSSAIKYICAREGSIGSANKTVPYLNCKTLGLTTDLLVPLSQIKTILTNNVRAVEIIPGEQTPFTVSLGVLNQTVNWLGASHCQAGQGGTLATLQELQNTTSDVATSDAAISGGRKKRTNKRTKKRMKKRMNKRMNKRRLTKKRKL